MTQQPIPTPEPDRLQEAHARLAALVAKYGEDPAHAEPQRFVRLLLASMLREQPQATAPSVPPCEN